MTERTIDLSGVRNEAEVYQRFFDATAGLVPDYGGRNLDALIDDLGDVTEAVTLTFSGVAEAARALDEWFGRFLWCLAAQAGPMRVVLSE